MISLNHRVRVFVFGFDGHDPRFLLVRHRPRAEWPLGPVLGPVGLGDHLEDAIQRGVAEETGLSRPHQLLPLADPQKDVFGDVGLIEWPYAYQAGVPDQPGPAVRPGPTVGEFAWLNFEQAYEAVGYRRDREALLRLRLRLAS